MITGTPSVPGSYSFRPSAATTNRTGCPGSTTYNLPPSTAQPSLQAPASIVGGTVNASCTQTFTATGGNGACTWSVISGSLPPGLTLSPAARRQRCARSAGSSNFTVQGSRDSNACLGSKAYAMTVVSLKSVIQSGPTRNNNGFEDSGEGPGSAAAWSCSCGGKSGRTAYRENGGGDDAQVGGNTVTNVSGVYGDRRCGPRHLAH